MADARDAPDAPDARDAPDAPGATIPRDVPAPIRDLVARLAGIPRAPGSPGEAEAAEDFAAALAERGVSVEVQAAAFHDGYAELIAGLCAVACLGGLLGLTGRRRRGATLAGLAALAIADDVSNAARVVRRCRPARATQNVVGQIGNPDAERTLVLLAHHDAAPTGFVFDDSAQRRVTRWCPGLIERVDTGLPLWWAVLLGPLLSAAGALTRRRGAIALGVLASAVDLAAFLDIARSPTVPGANDNLSALGAQLMFAEALTARPVAGLRVLIVSCGAEEVIQGGIYAFRQRHRAALDPERTWVLNLDTVGSPELVLLEGEGALVMEDYTHRPFRELIARVADRAGAPLRRGLRARNSTDAVVMSRAGLPTATLTSVDRAKALTHYHQMSDVPEHLHWRTVAHAALIAELVARELAANPWLS